MTSFFVDDWPNHLPGSIPDFELCTANSDGLNPFDGDRPPPFTYAIDRNQVFVLGNVCSPFTCDALMDTCTAVDFVWLAGFPTCHCGGEEFSTCFADKVYRNSPTDFHFGSHILERMRQRIPGVTPSCMRFNASSAETTQKKLMID